MSGLELLCSLGLIVPAISRPLAVLAPIAAICIGVEMLLFTGLHLRSGNAEHGQMIYWLVVAAFCAFVAYGRWWVAPLSARG